MAAVGITGALFLGPAHSQATTLAGLQWHRRAVLVFAANPGDALLADQRRLLSRWAGAADRDVSVIEIVASHVSGVSDSATSLRREYQVAQERFAVLLLGKDAHIALRSAAPVTGDLLEGVIDAMPMRQAGQR
jgi:hypothetical protein